MQGTPFPTLKPKAKECISKHECMAVEVLAEENGRKVLFTSPYHSDLHPIQPLWAKPKGNTERKHNINTTMTILKVCLDAEFQAAMSWHCSIKEFMRASREKALQFHSMNMENDNNNDHDEDSDSADDGNDSEDESDDEQHEKVGI